MSSRKRQRAERTSGPARGGGKKYKNIIDIIFDHNIKYRLSKTPCFQLGNGTWLPSIQIGDVNGNSFIDLIPVDELQMRGTNTVAIVKFQSIQHGVVVLGKLLHSSDPESVVITHLSTIDGRCGVLSARVIEIPGVGNLTLMVEMAGDFNSPDFDSYLMHLSSENKLSVLQVVGISIYTQVRCLVEHKLLYTDLKPANVLYRLHGNKIETVLGDLGSCFIEEGGFRRFRRTVPCPLSTTLRKCVFYMTRRFILYLILRIGRGYKVIYTAPLFGLPSNTVYDERTSTLLTTLFEPDIPGIHDFIMYTDRMISQVTGSEDEELSPTVEEKQLPHFF